MENAINRAAQRTLHARAASECIADAAPTCCSTRERVRTRDRGHASRARLTVPADIFRFCSPSWPLRERESERRVGGIARTDVAMTPRNLVRPTAADISDRQARYGMPD